MLRCSRFQVIACLLATALLSPVRAPGTPPLPPILAWPPSGVTIVDQPGFQWPGDVVSNGDGGAFVAWMDQSGDQETLDVYLQHVTATGEIAWPHWPAGFPVCTEAGRQFLVRMVGDGAGGVIAAWYDERGASPDIYALRVRSDGTIEPGWPTNGVPICDLSGSQSGPVVASDGASGAYVAWEDQRDGGPDSRVYLQRVLASGAIADGWPVGGIRVGNVEAYEIEPTVVPSPDGGAFVTWIRWAGESTDIVTTRVTPTGTIAPGWPDAGLTICAAPGHQDQPSTIPDGEGGFYAVWRDYRYDADMQPPNRSGVFVQRVTGSAGFPAGWGGDGVPARADSLEDAIPRIAEDGLGGALICWADATGYLVQRIDPEGVVASGWDPGGVSVGTTSGTRQHPALVGDGAGGAIVAWNEYHGATGIDVYAQRIAANGRVAPDWPATGTAVSAGPEYEEFGGSDPRSWAAVSDGRGGALVTWFEDAPYGGILIQRVSSVGVVGPLMRCPGCKVLDRVFPNPAAGSLHVRVRTSEAVSSAVIEVYDIQGRKRLSQRYDGLRSGGTDDLGLDLSRLPTGVYYIRVAGGVGQPARGTASVRVIR